VDGGVETDESTEHTIPRMEKDTWYWVRIDFENGLVYACVSSIDQTWDYFGDAIGDGNETSAWVRGTRTHSEASYAESADPVPYFGDYVGVGTAGGTGDVRFGFFEAGCSGVREFCPIEMDSFNTDTDSAFDQTPWSKISGTWPSKATIPLSQPVARCSYDVELLHLNPLPEVDAQAQKARCLFEIVSVQIGTKVACLFGMDSTAQNGYVATMEYEDAGGGALDLKTALYRRSSGSDALLDSNTAPAVGGVGSDQSIGLRPFFQHGNVWAQPFGTVFDDNQPDAGQYAGFYVELAGATRVDAYEFALWRVGTINEHWPLYEERCRGRTSTCPLCTTDEDWPYETLVEIEGVEDNNCDCSQANGAYYCADVSTGPCANYSWRCCQASPANPNPVDCTPDPDYYPVVSVGFMTGFDMRSDSKNLFGYPPSAGENFDMFLVAILDITGYNNYSFVYAKKVAEGTIDDHNNQYADMVICDFDEEELPLVAIADKNGPARSVCGTGSPTSGSNSTAKVTLL
jgi:hypothetical protein